MDLSQTNEETISIWLRVYPVRGQNSLPANFQLIINADEDELTNITTPERCPFIQELLEDVNYGDRFDVTITLGEDTITEKFEI